jgi:hypothetical protein
MRKLLCNRNESMAAEREHMFDFNISEESLCYNQGMKKKNCQAGQKKSCMI